MSRSFMSKGEQNTRAVARAVHSSPKVPLQRFCPHEDLCVQTSQEFLSLIFIFICHSGLELNYCDVA